MSQSAICHTVPVRDVGLTLESGTVTSGQQGGVTPHEGTGPGRVCVRDSGMQMVAPSVEYNLNGLG